MSTGVTIWEAAGANGGVKADLGQLMQLVGEGEPINAPNWAGCTPLHCAAPESNLAILRFLLDSKADVNKTTPYGLTPLHFACYYGRLENVELLLAHGANTAARTHDGYTPKDKALEGQKGGRAKGPDNKFAEAIELLTRVEANPQLVQQLWSKIPTSAAPPLTSSAPPPPQPQPATQSPPYVAQPAPSSLPPQSDGRLVSFIEQLEQLIGRHRRDVSQLAADAKEGSFQEMLREVVRLANSFERPAPSAPVAWSPAVASASSAPSWTATSSASPSFSATPQPSHTSFLPPAQPTKPQNSRTIR